MTLAELRKDAGLSQEALAEALGLKSKSVISEIENGAPASLRVALMIEKWSGGQIKAASLCPAAAEIAGVRPARKRRAA